MNLRAKSQKLTNAQVVDNNASHSTSIWRGLQRDVIVLGAGNIAVVLAQLIFRSILIASLVPVDYGRLSLILSIYNTVWIIGASGLPNSVARYIAIGTPDDDSAIIRSAILAGAGPIIVASAIVATISGILLNAPLAYIFGAIGLSSLVYSLLTMGILRGRGRMISAASVLPIAAIGEVVPLAILWRSGIGVTSLSAFGVFCLGNVVGLVAGIFFTVRTTPHRAPQARPPEENGLNSVPSPRQLLGFSMWLAIATAGIAILPLVIRLAATFDSYTLVAIIDVALVLFAIPQRVGTIIVFAVIPHASRALSKGETHMTISRREHIFMIIPFVFASAIVAFTPIVGSLFDALGKPEYAASAKYLALVLLAGPARILYGLVEGILIAHGEGRFLALTSLSITVIASIVIILTALLGSILGAFVVFVAAFWVIYLVGFVRMVHLTSKAQVIIEPN